MNKQTIRDIDLKGKRVLVRVDFNVPIENGSITDNTRITAALPTLKAILDKGPKSLVLMSHLGRPKDGVPDPKFSMKPVAEALGKLLGKPVTFIEDATTDAGVNKVNGLPDGSVAVLENTRFYVGETKNDAELARKFARFGEVFVNDAFGSAHRGHSSTEAVAHLMPAVAGLLMEKELDYLATSLENPKRPLVAILGEGFRQNQGDRKPAGQGRQGAHWRRHGKHVPTRTGPQDGCFARGRRFTGHGPRPYGEGRWQAGTTR